jgi:hypothetical protein
MTSMNQRMREYLKEYHEELYEKQMDHEAVQMRVDLAESLLVTDWEEKADEDCLSGFEYDDPYYDSLNFGRDDFGHEYAEDDGDPFPDDYDTSEREDYEEDIDSEDVRRRHPESDRARTRGWPRHSVRAAQRR